MKKKFFSKLLTVVLAASMMLTLLPVSAMGWETYDEGDVDAYAASDSVEHRILHLDCGRKYFTPDWVKALINEMSAAGYTQLQLAFGNDGLRFLLDDMSVTVDGTTYSSANVTAGIQAGNKAYYNAGDVNELTESEMDDIIAYAQNKGIEIVPLLNTPGHMDAILTAMEELGISNPAYSTSETTVDLMNADAVAFTQELVKKYVDYFKNQGCEYFNIGADEYANDINNNPQFAAMLYNGYYEKFVSYMNTLADYIVDQGMTPRCFNDGVYYNKQTTYGTPNSKIQVCYWSSGWSGFNVAPASYLADDKGFDMINTNGDYYYVLGKDDKFDNDYSYAANFSNTTFTKYTGSGWTTEEISNPVGSMFCIWCDYPNAETETVVAQKTRLVLRAMAARMQGKSIDNLDDSVVTGGFNENGTINVPSTETPTTSLSEACDGFTATMTAGGSQTLTLSKSATWTTSDADVIALADAETNGIATYGAPETLTATNVTATAVGTGNATIYATTADGTTYSSEVTVQADTTGATTVDVNLEVGKTSTAYTHEGAVTATGNNEYIATVTANTTTTGGTTSYESSAVGAGEFYISTTANDTAPTEKITLEDAGNGQYYVKKSDGTYIYPDASYSNGFLGIGKGWNYSLAEGKQPVTVTQSGSGYTFSRGVTSDSNNTKSYINWSNSYDWDSSSWKYSFGATGTATTLYLYKQVTTSGTTSTTLTFTGVGEGNTSVTVGNTTYNIHVTAPTTTQEKTLTIGSSLDLPAGAEVENNSNTSAVKVENGKITALAVGNATVTVVTKNPGGKVIAHYTYKITVAAEDLSNVTPLTIEYWITNVRVNGTTSTAQQKLVSANDAYGEAGVAVDTLVDDYGTKEGDNVRVHYWRTLKLESATNNYKRNTGHQTTAGDDDETRQTTVVTKVRYWNSQWQALVGTEWQTIDQTEASYYLGSSYSDGYVTKAKTQIVAYYMQVTDVTAEVTTEVVDYGNILANVNLGSYSSKFVLVDYSVKYEDGTESPSSFATNKTLWFHCDGSSSAVSQDNSYNNYRTIGAIRSYEDVGYEVYMITVTPTNDSASQKLSSNTNGNSSYTYSGTEKVAWAATADDYKDSGLEKYTSISGAFTYTEGGEPTVPGLEIYNMHGVKVTYYIRAVATEDTLTVIYWDEVFNDSLYDYNIQVESGTTFYSLAPEPKAFTSNLSRIDVTGCKITNAQNVMLTMQTQLSGLTQISSKYDPELYTYNGSVISDGGKTLYLYYTINTSVLKPSLVIDFGLPVTFDLSELLGTGTTTDMDSKVEIKYTKDNQGDLTYNDSTKRFTYTPKQPLTKTDILSISLTIKGTTVTTNVGVTPASNVLYEETFFTTTANSGWTLTENTIDKTQDAQKTGEGNYNVFGYDAAYASAVGAQGVYAAKDLEAGKGITGMLTTSFYGNGFDLIGNCGKDTGRVLMLVQGNDGNWIFDIDTRYKDGNGTTLNQVPLAHIELATEANYTVKIAAGGLAATTVSTNTQTAAYAMNSAGGVDTAVAEFLASNGLSIYDVEYVSVASAANSGIAMMTADTNAATVEHEAGKHVEIDSFRVYRSTNNTSYPDSEQNVTYYNILDVVDGSIGAYTEASGKVESISVNEYEGAGGPQNELYLANGQFISFSLGSADAVQVSLRAVSGETSWNNTIINSNTEMYYSVTPTSKNGQYVVTITNTGNALLAIGNVKIQNADTAAVMTMSMLDEDVMIASLNAVLNSAPVVDDPVEDTPSFKPELKVSERVVNLFRSKLVTLTITTSLDVETIEVNGNYLRPTNAWMVKMGWADSYTYVYVDTLSRGETGEYQITAYDIDGNPYAYYYEV